MARGEKTPFGFAGSIMRRIVGRAKASFSTKSRFSPRAIKITRIQIFEYFSRFEFFSSGLSSKRIILSPFTKEFRGEGHSYESLNFSGATKVAVLLNNAEKLREV